MSAIYCANSTLRNESTRGTIPAGCSDSFPGALFVRSLFFRVSVCTGLRRNGCVLRVLWSGEHTGSGSFVTRDAGLFCGDCFPGFCLRWAIVCTWEAPFTKRISVAAVGTVARAYKMRVVVCRVWKAAGYFCWSVMLFCSSLVPENFLSDQL